MKKLLVSLDIITDLTLSELSARLGRNPSQQYSHEKGEARGINDVFTETVWRLDSRIPATATLEEHLDNLAAQCPPAELLRSGTLPQGSRVYVDVAVFFDSANASISIPSKCIDIIRAYGATLEVNCYPSEINGEN